jgi:hypothetical protein
LKAPLIDTKQLLTFAHLFVVVNEDVADQAGNIGRDRTTSARTRPSRVHGSSM